MSISRDRLHQQIDDALAKGGLEEHEIKPILRNISEFYADEILNDESMAVSYEDQISEHTIMIIDKAFLIERLLTNWDDFEIPADRTDMVLDLLFDFKK